MANIISQDEASRRSSPRRPWQYVLVGMGAILAVSAATIVTSIILQPSEVYFSVADFKQLPPTTYYVGDGGGGGRRPPRYYAENNSVVFGFNLTVHNPSRRAGVVYRYVLVSMQLQRNGGRHSVRKTSVPANVTSLQQQGFKRPVPQRRDSNMTMAVAAVLTNEFYGFYSGDASATILVLAQAQFQVGLARSRPYNIRARCSRIDVQLVGSSKQAGTANCSVVAS